MILDYPEIPAIAEAQLGRVGLASGVFDLLHFHHVHFLVRARAQCDFLIVGVDADELVLLNKKKSPQIPEYQRTLMLHALRCVDAVFIMRNVRQFETAAEHAQVVFKNGTTVYGSAVLSGGAKLVVIPDVKDVSSTTEIIDKIRGTVPRKIRKS